MKNLSKLFVLALLVAQSAVAGYETGSPDQVLVVPHAGGRPKYGQVDLSQSAARKGTLPVANGGTGQTTLLSSFQSLYQSVATTLGDLVYGGISGTPTRLPAGSANQVLTMVSGVPAWANIGAAFTPPTLQKFTTAGSATWTRPTPAPLYIKIRMVGAGGAGGSNGTGGSGGNSTFNTVLIANGGAGAVAANNGAGGSFTLSGASTSWGMGGGDGGGGGNTGTTSIMGASGGNSVFGGAGGGGLNNSGTSCSAGTAAKANSGSGGGGGGTSIAPAFSGGGGGAGGYVEATVNSPASSYGLVVGAKGAGTGGGGGYCIGGDGADGMVLVEEYYQ